MFEPSKATKRCYLYTKKDSFQLAGVYFPGLFSTDYARSLSWLFIMALSIEVLNAWLLYLLTGQPLAICITFTSLNIVFAVLSRLPQAKITSLKIERIFIHDALFEEINRRNSAKYRLVKQFFLLLIVGVAAWRSVYIVNGIESQVLAIGLVVMFAIAAYLHISVTGYAIFEMIRWVNTKIDYSEFVKSRLHDRAARIYFFQSEAPVNEGVINNHSLYSVGPNKYALKSKGILNDDELISFVKMQISEEAKKDVAISICYHQYYNILNSDGGGNEASKTQNSEQTEDSRNGEDIIVDAEQ